MAGKPVTRGTRHVAYAIDKLSKNALADIVLDRVAAEIGEDANDEAVLTHLQDWVNTISRLRGDRPVNLLAALANLHRIEATHLERLRQQEGK